MGLTLKDLEEPGISDDERKSRELWINRTQANDKWAVKALEPIGILLTSHQANRPFLKASVESHSRLGYWITLAYDNYIDPVYEDIDHNRFMPPKDVMDKINTFVMGTYQTWGGPLYPYFWLLKLGVQSMLNFKYIYCANGDFVIERPEGFKQLFDLMGDADIMTSGPDRDDPPAANTAGFIARTESLIEIIKHLESHLIPWSNYEKHTLRVGNMEGRLGWAIKDLNLKQVRVKPPMEDMLRIPGSGTWYELIGFRHIHSELNYAYRNRGIPPPLKYMDERFLGDHDLTYLKKYAETNDVKVLEDWWEKN